MHGGRYPYQRMRSYPHLSLADIAVWDRFILAYPDEYEFVEYDVVVGDRIDDDTELMDPWEKNAAYLGKRKIDVVGFKKDSIDIIEVKPKANARALGQVIEYDFLYTRDYLPNKPTHGIIICGEIPPNTQEIAKEYGIKIIKT